MLNLGVIGYPFISPGPVGGNVKFNTSSVTTHHNNSSASEGSPPLPEVELYIRWWQLASFLPQLHFTVPPSAYKDQNIAGVARNLKAVKERVTNPALEEFATQAMEDSRPVIRPLWMLNPSDPLCQRIDDQFLIGDRILVAPVLHPGARQRDVYLPRTEGGSGVWKRGTDGTFFEGGQWLNGTSAELEMVLYFVRQADHARPGLL